jgi:hypothetical protein
MPEADKQLRHNLLAGEAEFKVLPQMRMNRPMMAEVPAARNRPENDLFLREASLYKSQGIADFCNQSGFHGLTLPGYGFTNTGQRALDGSSV